MRSRVLQAALAAVGAVIGAGFASGQEIAGFFSQFGLWSYPGIAATGGCVWMLARRSMDSCNSSGMPEEWQGRWISILWSGMFALLMLVTGGAMLSAGGEVAALMLPVHHAKAVGIAATVLLALWLARRNTRGQAWVSWMMTVTLLAIGVAGFLLPGQEAAVAYHSRAWESVVRGVCYAGMNMALAVPGIAVSTGNMTKKEKKRCAAWIAGIITALLVMGNGLILRHPALLGASLPFVQLMSAYGKPGYFLCGGCMYLAVVTTAGAALRGICGIMKGKRWITIAAVSVMLVFAAMGFKDIVQWAYPVLGGGCFVLMLAAFFR